MEPNILINFSQINNIDKTYALSDTVADWGLPVMAIR